MISPFPGPEGTAGAAPAEGRRLAFSESSDRPRLGTAASVARARPRAPFSDLLSLFVL